MTESDIIRILGKHCKERKLKFLAHVYRGSKGYILDGLALSQSYASMKTVGFEIKVSRSDFLRDKKWQEYLPVCNTFYFVSPPNIINKEDMPDGIGLYHCTESGLDLIKKAKRVDYDKNALFEVLQYIAINRSLSERDKVNSAVKTMHRATRDLARVQKEKDNFHRRNIELQNELYDFTRRR